MSRRKTTEEFIQDAIKVHGEKFDYSKVDYKNNYTKVCIICPKHGEFFQKPNDHLCGKGCPKCYGRNKTTEEWISEAKLVYPEGKYTFEKTKYVNARSKLIVTCVEHGEFLTSAHDFLRGHGCPVCNEYKLEREIRKFLIENNVNFESQKRFSWLGSQSLDFYLPDYKICIECQGEEHFMDKEFFNKRETLSDRINRDKRKKNLCQINDIEVVYFLNKSFVNYLNEDDCYFIDKNELLHYIKRVRKE